MKALAYILLGLAWAFAFVFAAWLVAQAAQWLQSVNTGLAGVL